MECTDKQLAGQLAQIIARKKAGAFLEKWEKEKPPFWRTLRNNAFKLLTPYY